MRVKPGATIRTDGPFSVMLNLTSSHVVWDGGFLRKCVVYLIVTQTGKVVRDMWKVNLLFPAVTVSVATQTGNESAL